jgi:amidase
VRDAALLLDTLAGPDPRDPLSLDAPADNYVLACDGDLKGLRVGWSLDFGYAAVDPQVGQMTSRAAQRFAELGCEVEEVVATWQNPADWASLLWDYNTYIRNAERAEQHPDWIEPSMLEQIERGRAASAEVIGRALLARTELYEQMRVFMEPYDLLLTPQMPCGAWLWAEPPAEIGGRATPTMFDRLQFTFPFNLNGWPAASVPCGFSAEGLPVALQIVAPWRRDGQCLRAAAAFEALQPWADQRPTMRA